MQSASTNITTFPGKVGISNANPTHTLAIGSNVYVDDTGSNKLTVTGVISGDGLGISNIQTANVLGLTDNVTRITTLETDLDNNSARITTVSTDLSDNSSRVTSLETDLTSNASRVTSLETDLTSNASRVTSLETDLTSNASRVTSLETDLSDNSSRITTVSNDLSDNSSRITTVSNDLSDNSSRITTVSNDLSDNSSRIDSLGDGAHTFTGVKTFQDDIILESNLRVNGSLTYANTVNMIVSDPIIELGANNQHTNDLGLVLTRHGNSGNDSNVTIFYDESQDNLKIGYTDNSASETTLTTTATGLDVSITGNVAAAYDTNTPSYFGRAAVGYMGQSDQASFSHIDKNTSTNFALKQAASGATHLNTPTGQHIRFSVNAAEVGRFTGGGDFKVGANKLYVDTSASEVQMYSQATGSTAGPDLVLMRNNPNNGSNNEYIGQIRYEGLSDTGNSRLYAKTTGKIKTATNGSEDGVIETMIKTGGSNRISVRHSGDKFLIQKGTDLQVGEVANLYVDTSTSRVGIKKSNPSYTLDVDGDINLSGDFYQGGSPFVSSLWTSSGTDLYYSSGSVGISNAAPDHDLSVGSNLYVHDTGSNVLVVDGNVNVSNTISTHRLTLNNVSITTTMDLAQVSNVGNVTSNVLQFTNPTTAFVTTGAVGIGTTSPNQQLQIYGNSSNFFSFSPAEADDTSIVDYTNFGATSFKKQMTMRLNNRAWYWGIVNNASNYLGLAMDGGGSPDPDIQCVFQNNGTIWTKYLRVKENVGIGTDSPLGKLQVDIADASAATATWDATKVVFGDIANGNSQGLGFGVSTNSHASIISLAPGVAWRGLGYYSAWHKWYINDVEKMRLDASGNLGIGTASPNAVLDIEGLKTRFKYEYRYQDYWTSNNNQTLTIPVSGGSARGLMLVEAKVIQVAANSSSNRVARVKGMISNYHTGNYYMTVIEGENVSAFETYMVGTSGSAAGTFTMKYRPQEGYQQSVVCRLYLKIWTGGYTDSLGSLTRTDAGSNSALTAPSWDVAETSFGGNVGINTTDPQAKLHVNGDKFIATDKTCYVSGQVTKNNGNTGAQTKNYFAVDISNGYNQFQIELRGYCRNSQGNGNTDPFRRFYTIARNLNSNASWAHTTGEDITASGWSFGVTRSGGSTSTQTIYFTVVMPNRADGATYMTLTATVLAQTGGIAHSARIP